MEKELVVRLGVPPVYEVRDMGDGRRLDVYGERNIYVAGVTHANDDGTSRQEAIEGIAADDFLKVVREPDNAYDSNAVALYVMDGPFQGRRVGFLPAATAAAVAPALDTMPDFKPVALVTERTEKSGKFHLKVKLAEFFDQ